MPRPPSILRHTLASSIAVAAACAIAGCSANHADEAGTKVIPATTNGAAGVVASAGDAALGPPSPPSPPPLDHPLRVLVGGDLLPHRPSLVAPAAVHAALAPLASLFGGADAVVANYEAATGDVDPKASRLAYSAPPGWLEVLPRAGVSAVTVANNHACDLGPPGLEATLDAAAKSGLLALGADATDPWSPRVLVEQNGKRVCAVAWTTLSNADGACARSRRLAFAPLAATGKQRIDRAMAKARAQCDVTIAIFHGGDEYAPQTSLVMDQAAHAAEVGADAVVIHHPHIASPVVIHATKDGRKVPLFASVGNLVTNQGESWKPPMFPVLTENRRLVCVNGWTRLGVLADLSFSFDSGSPRARLDWGIHLVWIDNEHADDRTLTTPRIQARLLEPARDEAIVAKLSEDKRGPVALFSDPCWFERDASSSTAPRDDRCSSATATASTFARSRAPKRATSRRKK